MHRFEFTVLGCNSALPASDRHPSAHVLNVHERFFLLDCGEGTQIQMKRYGIKTTRIDAIFITHLHGDHFYGLPGLLGTLHLSGREKELLVFSPPGLKELIEHIHEISDTHLGYPIRFCEVDAGKQGKIHESGELEVFTLPMQHRIPCCGYLFKEKRGQRNIRKEKVEEYGLSPDEIRLIKEGVDHRMPDGKMVPASEFLLPESKPRVFAFCSDTRPSPLYTGLLKGADVIYHEATFSEELKEKARKTSHSTAAEAGRIARAAGAGRLIIGHFSSRYRNPPTELLEEARREFEETLLAEEGMTYIIGKSSQVLKKLS